MCAIACILTCTLSIAFNLQPTLKSDPVNQLVELETRLAFQEHTLQVLNDVITRQQQQINALAREIETLKDRLRAAVPSPVGPLEDEKPPPHY